MAFDKLKEISDQLKKIRTYLIKIGPDRRQKGKVCREKFNEAKQNFGKLKPIIVTVNEQVKVSQYSRKEIAELNEFKSNIESIFLAITELTKVEINSKIMGSFDIRTATSLLPVMDDTENNTKQLIDAIDMYNSMLDDEDKAILITFVLKTRLSTSAKIRLNVTYNSVNDLLKDMRENLLPKKSDTAVQTKLLRSRQGDRTVENFGKELEQLFVDLTITQADGNQQAYNILKKINEKTAIKQFADGLKNPKLSTIVSARKYTSLKDAIQGALDESVNRNNNDGIISYCNRGHQRFQNRGNFSNRNFNHQNNRGGRAFHRNFYPNNNNNNRYHNAGRHQNYDYSNNSIRKNSNANSNISYRGNQRTYNYNRGNFQHRQSHRICYANEQSGNAVASSSNTSNIPSNSETPLNQFFRSNQY